jgi:predicted permease
MLATLLQDLRFGLRLLLAKPGFTLAAVLSLAIGIGANTTLFAVVQSFLLAPVAGIGAPERLVEIGRSRGGDDIDTMSYPDFRDYAGAATSLEGMYAYSIEALNVAHGSVAHGSEPQRALGMLVSGDYFKLMRVQASQGRLLGASDDDAANPQPVAVASYAAWKKWLAADPQAVGRALSINGRQFTLIGVAAPEFRGHVAVLAPDFYLPLHERAVLREDSHDLFAQRRSLWLLAGGRLKDGVAVETAQSELAALAQRNAQAYPDTRKGPPVGIGVVPLRGLPSSVRGPLCAFAALLFALIGSILLVACVNVAGMLIARGETRRHEIAMRFVLGASRARVVAQLFAESLLLALLAGAIGVALANWWRSLLVLIDPPSPFPLRFDLPMGTPVLAFALLLTLGTAVLFGLLPALRVSGRAPRAHAAFASHQVTGRGSRRRETLVVLQIALTLMLLASAGLFGRALQRAAAVDIGFDVQHVLTADFDLKPSGYGADKRAALQQNLLDSVQSVPGMQYAALAAVMPLNFSKLSFGCVRAAGVKDDELCPDTNIVSAGFFATLGMQVRGRAFDAADKSGGRDVCIVNETLARLLAADGDVLGRSFGYGDDDADRRTLSVVGVVPDGKYASLSDERQPFLFVPLTQWPQATTSLFVRGALTPGEFSHALGGTLHSLDTSLPVPQVRSMQDVVAFSLLPQRVAGVIAAVLGVVGMLLAAIGLYGLIAFHVASRTREFGIKLAMGATQTRVLAEVLHRGVWLCGIGIAVGGTLAAAIGLLASSLLFGVGAGDVLEFAAAAAILGATGLLACYLPARRAASIAPMAALRYE